MRRKEMFFQTNYGDLVDKNYSIRTVHPAVVIDLETGGLLKVGDHQYGSISNWFTQNMLDYQNSTGLNPIARFTYIAFDRYEGVLDIEEICTFINMLNNHMGSDRVKSLLSMDASTLKSEIKKYANMGF